jgi:DNA-binding GntR family transcriptional regulator
MRERVMTISRQSADPSHPGSESRLRLPERNLLADDVYQILKEGLHSRRIACGARLNLDQLARVRDADPDAAAAAAAMREHLTNGRDRIRKAFGSPKSFLALR